MYNHNYANDQGEIGNTQHNVAMAQNQNTTSKDDSQFRDTTKEQPSKDDELEEILSAMAFRCAGGITRSGRKEYTPAKAAIQALIRTEQKKLLAAVRERVVGEDREIKGVKTYDSEKLDVNGHMKLINYNQLTKYGNAVRAEQRMSLNKLEAEL